MIRNNSSRSIIDNDDLRRQTSKIIDANVIVDENIFEGFDGNYVDLNGGGNDLLIGCTCGSCVTCLGLDGRSNISNGSGNCSSNGGKRYSNNNSSSSNNNGNNVIGLFGNGIINGTNNNSSGRGNQRPVGSRQVSSNNINMLTNKLYNTNNNASIIKDINSPDLIYLDNGVGINSFIDMDYNFSSVRDHYFNPAEGSYSDTSSVFLPAERNDVDWSDCLE